MKGTTVPPQRLVFTTGRVAAILTGACLASGAGAQKLPIIKMPQGAFLQSPAPNVSKLVHEVETDKAVALRYARLFHLPLKMVPTAFRQLRLMPLAEDKILEVHFVKSGEKLMWKPRRVKKGTLVYALPDKSPVLIRVCGNPIRTAVSPEFYTSPVNPVVVPDFSPAERLVPSADSSIAFHTPVSRVALPPALAPVPAMGLLIPAYDVLPPTLLPAALPNLTVPQLRAAAIQPVYAWVHGPSGLSGFFGALPAALGLIPLLSLGGGSSSPTTGLFVPPPVITTPGGTTTPPVVTTPVVTPPAGTETPIVPPPTVIPPPVETPPDTGGQNAPPPVITPQGPAPVPEPGTVTMTLAMLTGSALLLRKRFTTAK